MTVLEPSHRSLCLSCSRILLLLDDYDAAATSKGGTTLADGVHELMRRVAVRPHTVIVTSQPQCAEDLSHRALSCTRLQMLGLRDGSAQQFIRAATEALAQVTLLQEYTQEIRFMDAAHLLSKAALGLCQRVITSFLVLR